MAPFFIVGVSRSGTSFLYRLLNEHPQIRLSYESRLFTEGWHCYRSHGNLTSQHRFNRLVDALIQLDESEVLNEWLRSVMRQSKQRLFEQHLREPSFTKLIEEIYRLPNPVSIWGNKMLRIEMVPPILAHWPDAKFLVVVRDPRAVYASQRRKWPKRRLKYSCLYWNIHTEMIKGLQLPETQLIAIRYEDFIADALPCLKRILIFAGILQTDVAANMLAASPPMSSSVERWRADLTPNEICAIEGNCFERMESYLYQPEHAKKAVRLTTLTKAVETILDNRSKIPMRFSVWRKKSLFKRFWLTIHPSKEPSKSNL